ncbi:MAG: hypothetical protein H7X99_05765 [Saprospiraceae bacterium]|nr:hypothetical protein [Saprospiraceae bacterium]
MLYPDKELNEMLFFFQISALKILAIANVMSVAAHPLAATALRCHWWASTFTVVKDRLVALIFKKNNCHYNLTFYLDRALDLLLFRQNIIDTTIKQLPLIFVLR